MGQAGLIGPLQLRGIERESGRGLHHAAAMAGHCGKGFNRVRSDWIPPSFVSDKSRNRKSKVVLHIDGNGVIRTCPGIYRG